MAFLLGATSVPLRIQRLAIPFACLLIAFLGYGSQYLFAVSPDLAPGPLTKREKWVFNVLLACLWWTYYKACSVDPGRYTFPGRTDMKAKAKAKQTDSGEEEEDDDEEGEAEGETRRTTGEQVKAAKKPRRYCRKCALPKPPRAHHCRVCERCIPKMDHHCPWTANCVSLQTFPHFLRFLVYTNLSLWTLLYLLLARFYALWENRHLPAYLGPTLAQLVWLTVFAFAGGIVSIALGIMLGGSARGWLFNCTMIEGWEVERWESVLERQYNTNSDGSFWSSDRDPEQRLTSEPVEFPYDIGFWDNLAAAMGTSNPLLWFFPLAGAPVVAPHDLDGDGVLRGTGWEYEENGMNDNEGMWPPPDPAKSRQTRVWRQRQRRRQEEREREQYENERNWVSPHEEKEAFRRRQERDLKRWEAGKILGELEEADGGYELVGDDAYDVDGPEGYMSARPGQGGVIVDEGKTGWVNADGEHLGDYGVDEDAEFDEPEDIVDAIDGEEDDEVPLGELIRRRKVLTKDGEDT
ncbi:DHHC zinc finger domain-containing protein [Xylariales sp. AK1849]|nr:DHHC zinc finger domain-containing protein [Xylariales sp. AK1849]